MTTAELRRTMSAGIAFIVLLVVGVLVSFGNNPDIKKHDSQAVTAAKYVTKLSDSGARKGLIIGAYLLILAALAFVWFSRGLAHLVSTNAASRLVGGLGVLGATAITISAMTSTVVAGAVEFGNEKVPKDGDTIRVVMDLSFPFIFVVFALASAALLATMAIRGQGFATWLRYAAWLGALGGVLAVIFFPMLVLLLWYLVFAIVVLIRPGAPAAPAAATASAPAA